MTLTRNDIIKALYEEMDYPMVTLVGFIVTYFILYAHLIMLESETYTDSFQIYVTAMFMAISGGVFALLMLRLIGGGIFISLFALVGLLIRQPELINGGIGIYIGIMLSGVLFKEDIEKIKNEEDD